MKIRVFFIIMLSISLLLLGIVGAGDALIYYAGAEASFDRVEDVPYNKVGLLLGTSKWITYGNENLYYRNRITAANILFKAGKIDYILVSGDNSTSRYNEPVTIYYDLIEAGVPAERIYLDYAGFRTLDSIVRSKLVFGQSGITVISQCFHNRRALFIANWYGIDAVAFNAQDVSFQYGFVTQLRERLARARMFFDLIFSVQPRFLGKSISIE